MTAGNKLLKACWCSSASSGGHLQLISTQPVAHTSPRNQGTKISPEPKYTQDLASSLLREAFFLPVALQICENRQQGEEHLQATRGEASLCGTPGLDVDPL